MMAESLIRVSGLVKTFGGVRVLDGVALDVAAGESVALLGPNGAGKTTLLKVLGTLLRPTRGSATVAGFDCVREAEDVRRNIGLVAHGSYLYEELTALENLKFWTTFAGRRAEPADLRTALADVDLDAYADDSVRTFSAGMKRRLSLARLALGRPRVLLLDEPFAALDHRARKWLETYLAAFRDGGGALAMVTHSFSRDLMSADRVVVLAAGRVALDVPRASVSAEELQRLYTLHTEDVA